MKFLLTVFIGCLSCLFVNATETKQQTLSIIKPDAVAANHIGEITAQFEKAGLSVIGSKMIKMTQKQAEDFYAEHQERPFYKGLVTFMSSGPIVVQVLEGPDAIALNRKLMGATNSRSAEKGTIRAEFGTDVEKNAVHGSDSAVSAEREIKFFFNNSDLFPR